MEETTFDFDNGKVTIGDDRILIEAVRGTEPRVIIPGDFSQLDPRWASNPMGWDLNRRTRTGHIGHYGCLITCYANLATYYGTPTTPAEVNDACNAFGPNGMYFSTQDNQGNWSDYRMLGYSQIHKAIPTLRHKSMVECAWEAAPMALIDSELAALRPVIVRVDHSPTDGNQWHYVLLDKKVNGKYMAIDPYPRLDLAKADRINLEERYGWIGDPARLITQVICVEKV